VIVTDIELGVSRSARRVIRSEYLPAIAPAGRPGRRGLEQKRPGDVGPVVLVQVRGEMTGPRVPRVRQRNVQLAGLQPLAKLSLGRFAIRVHVVVAAEHLRGAFFEEPVRVADESPHGVDELVLVGGAA